jgi:ParB family chromosome partitioning protein
MPIKVSDIKEGDRVRQTYKDIESLAKSIQDKGLLQPIVLTSDMRLVAGGRRLMAIKHLNWEEIPDEYIIYKGNLNELELRELELLENIERQDLTWQEEIAAKAKLDELYKSIHGDSFKDKTRSGWSTRKSAELVGESIGNFSEDVSLYKAMKEIPELANCETKTEAKRTFNKLIQRHARDSKLKDITPEFKSIMKYADQQFQIGDGLEGLKNMKPTQAYFAEVDPPYGIELDSIVARNPSRAKADVHKRYTEIPKKEYPKFCKELADNLYRVLGDDAWMIWWFGFEHYKMIYDTLTEAKFKVDRVPAIWYKQDTSWANPNPKYLLARDYEQFFLCRKGNVTIEEATGSTFVFKGVSTSNRTCSAEKPVELYERIIDVLIPKGTKCVGIIPFLGSGSCLRALYKKGHIGIGWDLDEENKRYFLSKVLEDNGG